MTSDVNRVFTDDQVAPQLLSVVRNARKYVIVVTPYIKLWGHAKQAIEQASKRKIKVTVIVRDDQLDAASGDIAWLQSMGANLLAVERLHAKIYLNEITTIIGSMNLQESSAQNSREIVITVQDESGVKQIREYVNTLQVDGKPINEIQPGNASHTPFSGTCIRCSRTIDLNPDRPLCRDCYDEWAQWENSDYPEQFCQLCGKQYETTYERPLCGACYWEHRSTR